jgi:type VI protein secretion system component Hcp
MNEHEQNETDEPEDLEPSAEDEEQVTGGATVSDFHFTKPIDKSTP